MKLKYLAIFLFILIYIATIELLLEYRAQSRGFPSHFLSMVIPKNISNTQIKQAYKYRSPVIEKNKPNNTMRYWMASASYAEDTKRKINELFPNVFCGRLNELGSGCQMINAAKAGLTIEDNVGQIKDEAPEWLPDYAILYSMNLDINKLSHYYLGMNESERRAAEIDNLSTDDYSFDGFIEEQIELSTIYGHLRRYLGGMILLSSSLHDDIGDDAVREFKKTIVEFIHACKQNRIKPVLVTFATQYNLENYKQMRYDDKLFLVRYNAYLSPQGWAETVLSFNKVIRETALEYKVTYIDLEKAMSGRKEYFTDYVHFTKEGHEHVGRIMAEEFILKTIN